MFSTKKKNNAPSAVVETSTSTTRKRSFFQSRKKTIDEEIEDEMERFQAEKYKMSREIASLNERLAKKRFQCEELKARYINFDEIRAQLEDTIKSKDKEVQKMKAEVEERNETLMNYVMKFHELEQRMIALTQPKPTMEADTQVEKEDYEDEKGEGEDKEGEEELLAAASAAAKMLDDGKSMKSKKKKVFLQPISASSSRASTPADMKAFEEATEWQQQQKDINTTASGAGRASFESNDEADEEDDKNFCRWEDLPETTELDAGFRLSSSSSKKPFVPLAVLFLFSAVILLITTFSRSMLPAKVISSRNAGAGNLGQQQQQQYQNAGGGKSRLTFSSSHQQPQKHQQKGKIGGGESVGHKMKKAFDKIRGRK